MASEQSPLRLERLTTASRGFADRLFAAHPELRSRATVSDAGDLRVQLESPTRDAARRLTIWLEGNEPRLTFGGWSTQPGLWEETDRAVPMLRLLDAILSDRVVLLYDLHAASDVSPGMVDLSDKSTAVEDLASRWAPGRYRFLSWTGAADRR